MLRLLRKTRQWLSRDIIEAIEKQSAFQSALFKFYALPDRVLDFYFEGKLVKMFIPDADRDLVQNEILLRRCFYELPTLSACRERYGLKDAVILDIGANIGNHAVFYGAVCQVAQCLAFEPNHYTASILDRNIRQNGLGKSITARPEAISARACRMRYDRHESGNLGGISFLPADDGLVQAISIDDLELTQIDFIKIDVEGTAANVIAGAKETLSAYRPPLLIEIWPKEMASTERLLASLGYRRTASLSDRDNYFYERGR